MDTSCVMLLMSKISSSQMPLSDSPAKILSDKESDNSLFTPTTGRSECPKKPPAKVSDYICYSINGTTHFSLPAPSFTSCTCSYLLAYDKRDIFSAKHRSFDIFFVKHRSFLAAIQIDVEPKGFSEALKILNGELLCRKKLPPLKNNGTWTLTSLPSHKKAL